MPCVKMTASWCKVWGCGIVFCVELALTSSEIHLSYNMVDHVVYIGIYNVDLSIA